MPLKFKGQTNKACFTLNNFTDGEQQDLTEFIEKDGRIQYFICGEESGDNLGTTHLQGYIRFDRKNFKCRQGTMSFWKGIPGLARAHFEPARGSDEDNKIYCSKVILFCKLT